MTATDVRGLIAKTGTAVLLATTGAVLLGVVMPAVFLFRPPLLGWVGFAVVCAIVIGLASGAAVSSPRLWVGSSNGS